MSESNLMFMPMIQLLARMSEEFGGKFIKTQLMTECLIREMPSYIVKLPVLNEALQDVC